MGITIAAMWREHLEAMHKMHILKGDLAVLFCVKIIKASRKCFGTEASKAVNPLPHRVLNFHTVPMCHVRIWAYRYA